MGLRPISVDVRREYPIAPGAMWDLLSNTDHMNRSTGMPHVVFGPVTVTADALYREARAALWGVFRLRWREYPFEWVRGERYAVLRLFESGIFDVFYGGVEIGGEAEQCSVRIFAEVTPRTAVLRPVVKLMTGRGVRDVLSYCDRFVALRASGMDFFLPPPPRTSLVSRPVLDRIVASLRAAGVSESVVARFARHVATASDAEVLRMQPYGLADRWGADRGEVLRLFLHAERQGGLYHTWEVMCPNCRVPQAHALAVAGIPRRFHCDGCGIAYDTDLEQSVELRFSVHPTLRPAADEVYCIGGPSSAPHVWAQQYLPGGTERTFSITLPDEPFRVRVLRSNDVCPLEPNAEGPAVVTFTHRLDGWFQVRQLFRPGAVSVRIRNEAERVMVAVLERTCRDSRAVTAAQLMHLPELREIAAAESAKRTLEAST